MEVLFAGTALTGPIFREFAFGVTWPWDVAVDVTPLFRSPSPWISSRGNHTAALSFQCLRWYADTAEAMAARAVFIRSLATSGQIEFSLTAGGQTLRHFASVVRRACPPPELRGRVVRFSFAFQAVAFSSTGVVSGEPDILRDATGDAILDETGQPITT